MAEESKRARFEERNDVLKGKGKRELAQVFFRAPATLVAQVEQAVRERTIPTTRQTWILEALVEKLEREQ